MDKFCLKWKEFESNIRESFKELREEERLFDVTLATDDGQHIQAHRVILSAGSNFFSDIFIKSDNTNMLIYLKGINSTELDHVINFLYNGEAFVTQEELTAFLETAKDLKLKGLQGNLQGVDEKIFEEHNSIKQKAFYGENGIKSESNQDITDQEIILNPLEENNDSYSTLVKTNDSNDVSKTYFALDIQIEEMIEKNRGLWICKVCGKTSKKPHHARYHAETHIEGVSYACHICNKTFSTRITQQQHITNIHSELFSCEDCEKTGMHKKAFRTHKQKYHKFGLKNIRTIDSVKKV